MNWKLITIMLTASLVAVIIGWSTSTADRDLARNCYHHGEVAGFTTPMLQGRKRSDEAQRVVNGWESECGVTP